MRLAPSHRNAVSILSFHSFNQRSPHNFFAAALSSMLQCAPPWWQLSWLVLKKVFIFQQIWKECPHNFLTTALFFFFFCRNLYRCCDVRCHGDHRRTFVCPIHINEENCTCVCCEYMLTHLTKSNLMHTFPPLAMYSHYRNLPLFTIRFSSTCNAGGCFQILVSRRWNGPRTYHTDRQKNWKVQTASRSLEPNIVIQKIAHWSSIQIFNQSKQVKRPRPGKWR